MTFADTRIRSSILYHKNSSVSIHFFLKKFSDQEDNLEIRSAFEKVFILIKFLSKNEGTHARRNLDGSSATTRETTATCFYKRMVYRKSWWHCCLAGIKRNKYYRIFKIKVILVDIKKSIVVFFILGLMFQFTKNFANFFIALQYPVEAAEGQESESSSSHLIGPRDFITVTKNKTRVKFHFFL